MFFKLCILLTLALLLGFSNFLVDSQTTPKEKVFMCYWGSWSHYEAGDGAFTAADIDPKMCTHVIYSFATINEVTFAMQSTDDNLSNHPDDKPAGTHNMYRKTVELKIGNPDLKVLIAVGGAGANLPKIFSNMASRREYREAFIASVMEHFVTFGFDGLDMDWEYPGTSSGGSPADKENFVLLLQELRDAFESKYILTAAVVAGKDSIAVAYDVPSISKSLDYILLMAYDYKGYGWNNKTGHNAPLFSRDVCDSPGVPDESASASLEYLLQLGAPPAKIALGLPAYGRTYTMYNRTQHNFCDVARDAGVPYPVSGARGIVYYFEICRSLAGNSNWEFGFDYQQHIPYAFNDTQWIGYDDEYSIMKKVDYAEEKGLGGMMLWSLEMDDCKNICQSWQRCTISYMVKERMAYHKGRRNLNTL